MLSVLACIALEHDPVFTALAVTVLTLGAVLTMRLFARVRRTQQHVRYMWLMLAGLIAGGTIWSTHFVSMLAYKSPFIIGYNLELTALSLLVAIAGTTAGLFISSLTQKSILIEVGGLAFGLSIAAMHFIGIEAVQVAGVLTQSSDYVAASIVLTCLFGMLATSRVARPVTLFCKYGGAFSFILAVASLHFVAMTGVEIIPLRDDVGYSDLVSERLIGFAVVFTMSVLMLSAFLAYSIDVVSAEAADSRMKHITHHDPLTGLPNRRGLDSFLEGAVAKVAMDNARLVAVTVNLSRFKEVNEVFGHAAGDALLRHVAKKLTENLLQGEFVARVNGDEFTVVGRPFYQRGYLQDLNRRIQRLVSMPMAWQQDTIQGACALGYAFYPDHADTPSALLRSAESAMRRSKTASGNVALCYDPEKDEGTRSRSMLAMDLRKALVKNEFELHYQLQNDAATRELTGVEVLLRWNHPTRGRISPLEFIPMLEETRQINEVGAWVVRTACREAATWTVPVKVAVNVAPVQLADSSFPDVVAHVLDETGLAPERLELEITETGIIADTSHALQIIHQLKRLGVRIAMDDFGTGYSSLATLQAFPIDKIKIDRSFVQNLSENPQSEAIVKATIILAKSLAIPVLAEGVETETDLESLAALGCNEVQGYLFSKPSPVADIHPLLIAATPQGAATQPAPQEIAAGRVAAVA